MQLKKAILLAGSCLALGTSAGCKKAHQTSRVAYIVGPTNDIEKMGKAQKATLNPASYNASVLIATQLEGKKIKFCSGTFIDGVPASNHGRILTNHHCFAKSDDAGLATPETFAEACTKSQVFFGFYAEATADAVRVRCVPGSLRTNFDGDLAVFEIDENPPAPYAPLPLWSGGDDIKYRQAYIVHYPDIPDHQEALAQGGAKLPVAAVTTKDCIVGGPFDPIEWDLERSLPFSIKHNCDLVHGSSGSALIDAETTTILGVNWGGIKITYEGNVNVHNVATNVAYVRAFIDNNIDQLANARGGITGSSNALGSIGEQELTSGSVPKKKKSMCGVTGGVDSTRAGVGLFIVLMPLLGCFLRGARKEGAA